MTNRAKCRFCKHKWVPRADKPLACPKCKRYDWEKEPDEKPREPEAPVEATSQEK